MRTLWDNYYVPFIKGYFSASGRFHSDDVKTGNIIAYVGSSSSATFFPTQVIADDMDSHDTVSYTHLDVYKRQVYMDIIKRANRYVHIMTPYLIIDNEMITALTYAARRGVEVQLILPHEMCIRDSL